MYDKDTLHLVNSGLGALAPDNEEQNKVFSDIIDMHLDAQTEAIYVDSILALLRANEELDNRPLIQPRDILHDLVGKIVDKIN